MINVDIQRKISATPQQLQSLFLDHQALSRFFDAKFKVIRPAEFGQVSGGVGCQRQVTILGYRFIEQIYSVSEQAIEYGIVGDVPLRQHKGVISIQAQTVESSIVRYTIVGFAPYWLPDRLASWLLGSAVKKALTNIEQYLMVNEKGAG